MLEIALAKLAALGVTTKAAFGVVTAASVVAVGGAATGVPVLPQPAQDRPAAQTEVTTTTTTSTESSTTETTATTESETGPADAAAFGQLVAADAKDGGVDGQVISDLAHQRNEARKAARQLPEQATAGHARAEAAKAEADTAKAEREATRTTKGADASAAKGDNASETGVAARSQAETEADTTVETSTTP